MPDKNMRVLEKVMDIASYRRRLLTSNIANADTPGYKAKDISFKQEVLRAMEQIDRGMNARDKEQLYHVYETVNTMPNRDGNTVNVDIEMAKIAENSLIYNTATQIYSRKARMLRDAIKAR